MWASNSGIVSVNFGHLNQNRRHIPAAQTVTTPGGRWLGFRNHNVKSRLQNCSCLSAFSLPVSLAFQIPSITNAGRWRGNPFRLGCGGSVSETAFRLSNRRSNLMMPHHASCRFRPCRFDEYLLRHYRAAPSQASVSLERHRRRMDRERRWRVSPGARVDGPEIFRSKWTRNGGAMFRRRRLLWGYSESGHRQDGSAS